MLIGLYDSAESFRPRHRVGRHEGFLNDPDRVVGAAVRINAALNGGALS
jgi:hypothetical protein